MCLLAGHYYSVYQCSGLVVSNCFSVLLKCFFYVLFVLHHLQYLPTNHKYNQTSQYYKYLCGGLSITAALWVGRILHSTAVGTFNVKHCPSILLLSNTLKRAKHLSWVSRGKGGGRGEKEKSNVSIRAYMVLSKCNKAQFIHQILCFL